MTSDGEPAESVIELLAGNETRRVALVGAGLERAKQQFEARQSRFSTFRDTLRPAILNELSTFSNATPDPDRFVATTESVLPKATAAIRKGIRETFNSDDPARRPPARTLLHLTDDDVAELRANAAPDGTIGADALATVAARHGQTAPTTYIQAHDRRTLCLQPGSHTDCAFELLDPVEPQTPVPPVVIGDGVTEIDDTDIPRYLARLMEPLTAPEEKLLTGLMPVATLESVKNTIGSLSFPPSPADVPAYHDFTNLQIAFDSVWQEHLHQGVVDLFGDVYEAVVELGGDPSRPAHANVGAINGILAEGRSTLRVAREVRDHRNGSPEGGTVVTGSGRPLPPRARSSSDGGCSGADQPVIRDHRSGDQDIVIRDHRSRSSADPAERLPALLQELERRLQGKHAFTIFAANAKERSINFGVLMTYRQVWTPLAYQAGPLVKSIPLAPGQTQKVVIGRKTIKKRAREEIENNLRETRDEMSATSRTEQEIIRRAQIKNDFSVENVDKGGVEPASHTTTTRFGHQATKSSDDIKKTIQESVFKSALQIRQEHVVKLTSEDTEEFETTETTEISNPSGGCAVTFLLYELERCHRVKTMLRSLLPVVFVAQEFPQPHEINAAWLVAHDWILKRVILDDSFLPTLNSLTQASGNESAIAEMRYNVQQQRCIVDQLREEVASARKRATLQQSLLERAVFQKAGVLDDGDGILGNALESVTSAASDIASGVSDFLFGGGGGNAQSNRQALEERAQAAADQARELMFRLEREVTALNALTETYTRALREHHTLLTEIARLETHVAANAMYYMHKIWAHEPPDQRYFRLHNVPVPVFKTSARSFVVDFDNPVVSMQEPHEGLPRFGGVKFKAYKCEAKSKILEDFDFEPLSKVANLHKTVGFFGNYIVFELNESNAVTDAMMDPFVDRATGQLVDPSDPTNWTIDEFAEYVCCLKEKLDSDEFAQILPQLREQYKAILTTSSHQNDVLVVPSNSLFIEALPAGHEVLDNFQRAQRVLDVKSAQADHRAKELENIRRAARLLNEEREDPNIDKRILIQGGSSVVVPSDQ